MPAKHNIRLAAHAALRAWAKGHDYAEVLVERHAQRYQISPADRHLLQAIVFGVLRHRRLLDYFISELRRGKLDHDARDLLRIGLYQILILNLADHAAVNETVEAGKAAVRGLINAVLRAAIVKRKKLLDFPDDMPPAIRLSHPDWLFNRWRKQYGLTKTIELMEWNQQPAEVYGRYNPLCGEPCPLDMSSALEGAANFYLLEGALPTQLLSKGIIYIQDPATRHAVELLAPQAGEKILDACAAPGGKTAMIAAAVNNGAEITATDSNEKRLPRMLENLRRAHAQVAEVEVHDWTTPAPEKWQGKFDAILLDAPCSNTGVLRRRVDARWRIQSEDFSKLAVIQSQLIRNCLPCLKEGGRLAYSTCSLDEEENLALVKAACAEHAGLSMEKHIQVSPQLDHTDGAFAALLVYKKK